MPKYRYKVLQGDIFIKNNQYQLLLFILLSSLFTQNVLAGPIWQSNRAFLLHGNGYEVDADEQSTLTLEHASAWLLGDLFIFVDLTKYHGSDQGDGIYGELSPRLSLTKMTGNYFQTGLLKDILIASSYEFGKGDVKSFLLGAGFDLNVPGFDFFSVNIYQRFPEGNRDGKTIQLTPVWAISRLVWGSIFTFEGFIDWNVNSHGYYHSNIHFNPRLKYDLGNLLDIKTDQATFGLEYS